MRQDRDWFLPHGSLHPLMPMARGAWEDWHRLALEKVPPEDSTQTGYFHSQARAASMQTAGEARMLATAAIAFCVLEQCPSLP